MHAGGLAAAVVDGVRLAGGGGLSEDDVEVAFYGDVFRPADGKGDPLYDARDVTDPFEVELLHQWWVGAAANEPDRVPPPSRMALTKAPVPVSVQHALDAVSRSRFLAGVADSFLIGALRQVRCYLTEPAVRAAVLERVNQSIGPDTRVVVGHSLGSVVAYEALCTLPDPRLRALVTLGSPLGIRKMVFDRLTPAPQQGRGVWPSAVDCWTNVCDRYDVVALVKRLAPLFGTGEEVADETVANGWRAHELQHHLTAEPTGRAIAAGLAGAR